ncbi:MAG: TIGR03792 family protein [Cyanobium sp.]
MELNTQRQPLDAPGIPEVDGELSSQVGDDGRVEVEVIEHLRVSVPAAARLAWLEAEQATWEPWLRSQAGFLGRDLRWDSEREEGQLLIRWASRAQWHAIPHSEIEAVQERFERHAHAALQRLGVLVGVPHAGRAPSPGDAGEPAAEPSVGAVMEQPLDRPVNPFPLVFSGELPPESLT